MIHDIVLVPHLRTGWAMLSFRWNDETGELSGPDADAARAWIAPLLAEGGADISPRPSYHVFSAAPMRSAADLAAAFGESFTLPRVWADAYPHPPEEPPPEPGEVSPVY